MPTLDPVSGLMSWTPRQPSLENEQGFDIVVTVTDEYNLADTVSVPMVIRAVNDPPESFLGDSLSVVTWEEDTSTTINLGKYFFDVDNGLLEADGFEFAAIVLGTEELDEDFPLGVVFPGPGTSNEFLAKVSRRYMGFDPNMNFTSQNLTSARIQQINSVRDNHLLQVEISEIDTDGDGVNDSTMAYFISDTNYYGANHSVIFTGRDLCRARGE